MSRSFRSYLGSMGIRERATCAKGCNGRESEAPPWKHARRSFVSDSLCPMDCTVRGVLQVRRLEWVAFPFSRGSSQPRD